MVLQILRRLSCSAAHGVGWKGYIPRGPCSPYGMLRNDTNHQQNCIDLRHVTGEGSKEPPIGNISKRQNKHNLPTHIERVTQLLPRHFSADHLRREARDERIKPAKGMHARNHTMTPSVCGPVIGITGLIKKTTQVLYTSRADGSCESSFVHRVGETVAP